jgi:sugar/nucleoside kinase (ribokinase family)
MLFGLSQGWPEMESLKFAAAAASLNCAHLGATGRIPSVAEVHAHIAAHAEVANQFR